MVERAKAKKDSREVRRDHQRDIKPPFKKAPCLRDSSKMGVGGRKQPSSQKGMMGVSKNMEEISEAKAPCLNRISQKASQQDFSDIICNVQLDNWTRWING